MVLADRLKPERLDAKGAFADLAVPDEESGSERLAIDFGPARRINQEHEHVLFASVEPGAAGIVFDAERRFLGRLKIGSEFREPSNLLATSQPFQSAMNETAGGRRIKTFGKTCGL